MDRRRFVLGAVAVIAGGAGKACGTGKGNGNGDNGKPPSPAPMPKGWHPTSSTGEVREGQWVGYQPPPRKGGYWHMLGRSTKPGPEHGLPVWIWVPE